MPVSGTNLALAGLGAVFVWGGLTGRSPLQVAQAIIRGNSPLSVASVVSGSASTPQGGSGAGTTGTATSSTAAQNQAIAKMVAAPYGWDTGQQWSDLVSLWNKESGWNNTADTRKTGAGGDNAQSTVFAYGVAQARPATKYPLAGQPPDLGGQADPTAQIQWGLQYISQSYGNPSNAWAHELQNNWY